MKHFLKYLLVIFLTSSTFNIFSQYHIVTDTTELRDLRNKIKQTQLIIDKDKKNGANYLKLADLKTKLGDYPGAYEAYNKSEELGLQNVYQLYHNRGALRERLVDHEGAIQDFTRAIELKPTDALSYNDRGQIYYLMKKYDLSISDFENALKYNKDWTLPLSNLAMSYKYTKQSEKALEYYNLALKHSPEDYRVLYNKGILLMEMEKYDVAQGVFTEAIHANDHIPVLFYYRGYIEAVLGELDEACEDFKKAESLGQEIDPKVLSEACNRN